MREQVRKIIAQNVGMDVGEVSDEKEFGEIVGTELDRDEILDELENDKGVQIDDDMISDDKTIGEVLTYIEELIKLKERGE